MEQKAPVLVAVEGIDGSGLSTHSRLLAKRLQEEGWRATVEKEPTHSPIGMLIREVLAGKRPGDNTLLALLFAADRYTHLYSPGGVIEELSRGTVVVMDRYKYSSLVYQTVPHPRLGAAPRGLVEELNRLYPPAHILVVLDVDPSTALNRLRPRARREAFEEKAFLEEARKAYLELAKRLERKPEYCGGDAPWRQVVETLGFDPETLWPPTKCYPIVVVVRESISGAELGIEDTAKQVYQGVKRALDNIMP